MTPVKLDNVRRVREVLGVSQSQAGRLLGVSTKAVQSYEQGLRAVPAHVQRAAALLLYTRWRKKNGTPAPCWSVNQCAPEVKSACPAHRHEAGDLCWMLTGTVCQGVRSSSPEAKMAQCQKCPVMTRWLRD